MKAINYPKITNSFNLTHKFPTKNLTFLTFQPHNPAKTLNSPLFLAHCTKKPHIQNQSDNTFDENPTSKTNVEFTSNQNEPQKTNQNPRNPQVNPTKPSSRGLIFDLGENGCWDSTEVGSPVVKRFQSDDQERWYMWYYGTSEKSRGSGLTGLAVSSNGVHWERGEQGAADSVSGTGVVMSCGEDWWAFDTKCIRPSEVMVMSSTKVRISSAVYWLYYTGFSSESEEVELPQGCCVQFDGPGLGLGLGVRHGSIMKALPGLAISQDGRNWARIEGDHHSGALFDVGSKGEWDSLFIASPHVVFHASGDLRMYYHSFDAQELRFSIGIARSRDGIKWVKLGKIKTILEEGSSNEGCFDEMGMLNACVVRDSKVGSYLMAYEGVSRDGKRSIGIAVSEDGLKDWKRVSEKAVLVASSDDDGWDSKGVGCPCLVQMDGEEDQWRLYYTGFGAEGRTGIGMAVSQGSDFTSFRRWTGFHL